LLVGSWIGEITMVVRLLALGLSLLLLLSPVSIAAQQTAPTTSNPATSQQPPVIHSTTRLVQLSVIAQDGKGEPITGLKKEDFSLFDEGKPQVISFFACGTPAPAAPPPALPANYFTNRFDLKGEEPGAVTVILFDSLNTAPQDQSYVRKQVLRFLLTLKPQDHVAIYALTNNLIILHEFTQDSSALVAALNRYSPRELAAYDASTAKPIDFLGLTNDPQWQGFQNALNNAEGMINDQNLLNRIGTTAAALEIIADHLAMIPGRKSLVWVSGGFPIQIGMPKIGTPQATMAAATSSGGGGDPRTAAGQGDPNPVGGGDPTNNLPRTEREFSQQTASITKATRALNRVNVAVYPVEAQGVETNAAFTPGTRSASTSLSSGGFFGRQDIHDSSNLLADRTGGKAFYGNNDIRDAVRRAFDDGRYACNIGYYPDHGQWDGKFRGLKVKVSLKDAHLRYRQGYYAFADRSGGEEAVNSDLQQASMSPLETTNLGLIVNGKTIASLTARNLQLQVGVDPKQLLLTASENRRKGSLDMVFVQTDSSGNLLVADKQHFDINFEQKQYEFLTKAGMILQRTVVVQPQADEVRVVVRDAGSGAVGSVNIPVKAFFPADENASRPKASN
jgi:VWFA-related protein